MIWNYPGFPSIFVTYGTTNDFFFSGHTAIAILGAIVCLAIMPWYIALIAIIGAIFEIWAVLVLRAHYTMDIIGAILGAGCAYILAQNLCEIMGI
jgi:membrane-associated phospholipid phosphatase